MKVKIKNREHSYDIRQRHGFKMCLSVMMVMSNKQHLSNIWSWIHEKAKQHWGWVEKSDAYIKKACIIFLNYSKTYFLRFQIE